MTSIHSRERCSQGFTLLELSVVIVVMSLMLGGILSMITQETRRAKMTELKTKMDTIEKALMDFRAQNDYVPCPAKSTLASSDSNFGIQAQRLGIKCHTGTPAVDFFKDTTGGGVLFAEVGVVPARTLGLSDSDMYDPWGNLFTFAVSNYATLTNGFGWDIADNHSWFGIMTIKDLAGNTRATNVTAVLLSHGPNGHGAFMQSGSRKNTSSSNANELINCHCNSDGTNGTGLNAISGANGAIFIMGSNTISSGDADVTKTFDDILRYYVPADFMNPETRILGP